MSTPPIRIRRATLYSAGDPPPVMLISSIGAGRPEPAAPLEPRRSAVVADRDLRAGVDDHPDALAVDRGVDQHQPAEGLRPVTTIVPSGQRLLARRDGVIVISWRREIERRRAAAAALSTPSMPGGAEIARARAPARGCR